MKTGMRETKPPMARLCTLGLLDRVRLVGEGGRGQDGTGQVISSRYGQRGQVMVQVCFKGGVTREYNQEALEKVK